MRFFIFFLFTTSAIKAQDLHTITGKVTDSRSSPIFMSSIKAYQNEKLITGAKTDKNGQFSIKLPSGSYKLEFGFIGYKVLSREIKVSNSDIQLGSIVLLENSTVLSEILVTGNKTSKSSAIDKKEYSPSQLLNSQNASAAELVNALPSVNMGNDGGNVSFRGDENVAVMINGKMSSLTGENLSQIPATSIEKIEIISVPNSKYNSEGSAGIINIVLKNANASYNGGYVIGSIGNNNKYNGQIGYNFSLGKLAIASSYNYTYNEFLNCGWSRREYLLNPELHSYRHISDGESYKRLHAFRLGLDYEFSKRSTISLMTNISRDWGSSFSDDYDTFRTKTQALYSIWKLENRNRNLNTLYDINLSFQHFMPNMKDKWTIEVSRSDNMNDQSNSFNRNFAYDIGIPKNYQTNYSVDNIQRRPITAIQTDYTMNLSSNQQFETGLRAANRDFRFTNSYKESGIEVARWSNDFNFNENVFSAYGLWSSQWSEAIQTKLGVRLEQTNTESFNYDTSLYAYNYFNAFPSGMIRYNLPNKQFLSATYSMRINRPGPGMLNPLQDVSDPISKRLGNPQLKPEIINSYELGYGNDRLKNLSFSSSLYFKVSNNAITRYLTTNPDGTIFVTIDNIGKATFSGWELIGTYKLSKTLSLNFNSNLSYNTLNYTNQNQVYERDYLNWQARGILNIKLPWNMEGQVIGFYKSPFESPQGTIHFMSNVDISLRKKLFNQKANIILTVFDIFNDTKFRLNNSDFDFLNEFERKRETRYFTLSFRYNFGSDNSSKKSKIEKPEPREGGGEMGM
ncbi:MAG: TonB-dependent receptor [Chitinophagales bacterium]|nr:TonB-dependent receptor [Chitinophagales bacterium]